MSKPPKPAAAKKPAAKAKKAGKARGKAAGGETLAAEPVAVEAEEPVAKPVAKKAVVAKPAAAGPGDAAMVKRLQEMTDFQLRAYQMSTARISRDVAHAKSAVAKSTLVMIETEMARRVATPGTAPSGTRAPVASPKTGKKG